MTSDIDKLLELLRHVRDFYAEKPRDSSQALEYARHIAAVEQLVAFEANHGAGSRGQDATHLCERHDSGD